MELNSVRVFVNDLHAAKQFYGQLLGLPLKADGVAHGYCVFKCGSTELVVESVPDDAPDEEKVLVGRFTGLSFTVKDIAVKHLELRDRGVPFTGEPERQPWGGVLATLRDPSGNELQICQRSATASAFAEA